jgi:uncharacterized protein YxjI
MLDLKTYVVKERVAVLKLTDSYEIFDAESGHLVGEACEEIPGWSKVLRLVVNKKLLPTQIAVYDTDGQLVFRIRRGVTLLRSKVDVETMDGRLVGYFKSKLFTIGGGFTVHDPDDDVVAQVKGDWKGWNFQFLDNDERSLGTVTKQWGGMGKELFTSADTYVINLAERATGDQAILLLAAGLAVDCVFKEA